MAPTIQPAYLTPELAATYLGKSVSTLRRWTELYNIPTYGPGQNQYRPADLAAVSALLGHADIATTQKHYYRLMAGEKARAVGLLPQIAEPKAGKLVKIR